SIFLSSLCPLPPRSTLFPYTTLFRSCPAALEDGARERRPRPDLSRDVEEGRAGGGAELAAPRRPGGFRGPSSASTVRRYAQTCRDRKSTRLNSSHDQISYAVFCLKKK